MVSFRKHENGTWEYRIRYKDPFTQKYKEKSKRGFKTKKEAALAAAEAEKRLLEGYEQSNMLLETYLLTWLEEYKKGTVRKNTYVMHERNVTKHIIPYFKKLNLTDLKPMIYQEFINYLCDQGYSKRTVQMIHQTMHNAMEKAVILGKLDRNPCVGVEIKTKKTKASPELEYIPSEDIPAFLRAAYEYGFIYYVFFKTLIYTGMRKGEAAALQWSDVDLKNRTITINKTLDFQPRDESELFGDPKTFTSKRTITISKQLANDLQNLLNRQNDDKLNLNDIYRHDLNLVFARKDGSPLPKSTLFNAFNRILKRAGLPKMPIHALRHTHAVLLLESGASMKYVQERLGHKSMQVTADIYSHISKKIDQEAMNRFENYMSSIE